MKTDPIEIFQTIRAVLQPYATLGFSNKTNSDAVYDLWSDKNALIDGEKYTEVFFCSLEIQSGHVELDILPDFLPQHESPLLIKELDEVYLNQIEGKVAAGYKVFKENEWI
ncbi:hypothetical protein ACSBL2_13025 [Pedobacter sp. AW31-3R]|uniref:hypothetical protein n=1 Tax=Pedobacter sp. AW31-3R TaxID=3445781 RepID=UPI003FA19025